MDMESRGLEMGTDVLAFTGRTVDSTFDPDLIRRYGVGCPRYTSYPTSDRFVEAIDASAALTWLGTRTVGGLNRPLGLYVHLPFFDMEGRYRPCNRMVHGDQGQADKYLRYLQRELDLVAEALGDDRRIMQMQWGGGAIASLDSRQLRQLADTVGNLFSLERGAELTVGVDSGRLSVDKICVLADIGFNALSIGSQDFHPKMGEEVLEIQGLEKTVTLVQEAQRVGFRSVNLGLMYGLPMQSVARFDRTLDRALAMLPERISLCSYADLPRCFNVRHRMAEAKNFLAYEASTNLLSHAIRRLIDEGYLHVGMDTFGCPNDALANATQLGRQCRNFQKYSTEVSADFIGVGTSAIGKIGPAYLQNAKEFSEYYDKLNRNELPVVRGIELEPDDLVRRSVIQALTGRFEVSMESIGIAHLIDFRQYFSPELNALKRHETDGLIEIDGDWITVTPKGKIFVHATSMIFDKYLQARLSRAAYSRVI